MNKDKRAATVILVGLLAIGTYLFFKGRNTATANISQTKQPIAKSKSLDHTLWYKKAFQQSEESIKNLLQKTPLISNPQQELKDEYLEIGKEAFKARNTLVSAMAFRILANLDKTDTSFLYAGNIFMENGQKKDISQEERQYSLGSAIEMYKKSLEINPNSIVANNSIAVAIIQEGQSPPMLGISYLKKSLTLDSNNISSNYLYAQMLTMSTQYEKAIKIYNKLINLQPSNAELYFSLSEIYGKMGNAQKAKEALNRAKTLNN